MVTVAEFNAAQKNKGKGSSTPGGGGGGGGGNVNTNPYQQAAESMLSQGITSLSGTTGGAQGQQAAQQQQDQGFQTIQQEAQEANQLDQMLQNMEVTKEEEETPKNKVKAKIKKLGDWFDENVFGEPIETLDAEKRKEVLDKLKEFQKLDVGLFQSFMLNRGNLLGKFFGKDQTYSDMQGNIISKEEALDADGNLKEGVRYTKEGFDNLMEDTFGKGIFETLKKDEPQVYYPYQGLPQSSGELLNLADNTTLKKIIGPDGTVSYQTPKGFPVSKEEGEKYNDMIFAARAELDRMGKNYLTGNPQGGGQPQGFPGIPGIPSLPIPKPPEEVPSYPIFGPQPPFMPGPIPFPVPLPDPTRPPFGRPPFGDKFERPRPYNYFAQSPQYRFRGIPSVNTDAFNEELRKRFGMA